MAGQTNTNRWYVIPWYVTLTLILALALLVGCGPRGAAQEPITLPTTAPDAAPTATEAATAPETATETQTGTEPVAPEPVATEPVANGPVATVALPTLTPSPEAIAATAVSLPRPDEVTIALETRWEGLNLPVFVTHAGDGSGRIFILEKTGAIRVVRDGALLERPFLDIRERVNATGNEQGLLGLAFAPDYAASGTFYVHYSDLNGDTMISRFSVTAQDADLADAASEVAVLQVAQPARNHNGGMLAFGPDGYLYVGLGDGGGAGDRFGNGQNPTTLLGKMLRLDVTGTAASGSGGYAIPADNPWVDVDWNGIDVRDEIWAVGLRNPWRYSFDRETGDLWIGDVGQNQYEEIHLTPAGSTGGLNYGWPILEGTHCYSASSCSSEGLELPVAEYSHSGGHCSVTGGYVYRGASFPALFGTYFYGDYCSGVMWANWPDGQGGRLNAEVLRSGGRISSFGEDEAGELYVADMGSGTVSQLVAR